MRYWFDLDCLVVHLSSAASEANPLMAALIAIHPLLYAVVKLSAAAGVSVLLYHSLSTSRRERGFVALLALSGVSLTLWNLAYIHALA